MANKPPNLSSAALVAILRRLVAGAAVGHSGTLDRFAEGLMVLLVGRATSLAQFLLHADKSYIADFCFGLSTDTADPNGRPTASLERKESIKRLQNAEQRLIQIVSDWKQLRFQRPPLYSALKKEGRRYSDHARSGKLLLPPLRPIQIYESKIAALDISGLRLRVELKVSAGTYIRSFAADLERQLAIPVHLAYLRRITLGEHRLEESSWQPPLALRRKPEKRQPKRAQSEKTQSERTQSERTQPERTQSERTQSERAQPERAQPERVQSEGRQAVEVKEEALPIISVQELLPHWRRAILNDRQQLLRIKEGQKIDPQLLHWQDNRRVNSTGRQQGAAAEKQADRKENFYGNFFIEDRQGRAVAWAVLNPEGLRYRRVFI